MLTKLTTIKYRIKRQIKFQRIRTKSYDIINFGFKSKTTVYSKVTGFTVARTLPQKIYRTGKNMSKVGIKVTNIAYINVILMSSV